MKRSIRAAVAGMLLAGAGSAAHGALLINEVFIDAPGGADNGQEFVEIRSDTDGVESMAGVTLVFIEGDGANAGTIDAAYSLNAFLTGTNGLFLRRDSATVLSPAPAAATVVSVVDFNPDIENGSNTFMLVTGYTGTLGTDLDAGNDGTLDSTPWTSVVHAVGVTENDTGINVTYAAQFGFTALGPQTFNPDSIFLVPSIGLVGADVTGASPGPYTVDGAQVSNPSVPGTYQLSPGNSNPPVPEPASLSLGALGLLLARRRRGH